MYSSPEYTILTPCHHFNSPAAAKSLSVKQSSIGGLSLNSIDAVDGFSNFIVFVFPPLFFPCCLFCHVVREVLSEKAGQTWQKFLCLGEWKVSLETDKQLAATKSYFHKRRLSYCTAPQLAVSSILYPSRAPRVVGGQIRENWIVLNLDIWVSFPRTGKIAISCHFF